MEHKDPNELIKEYYPLVGVVEPLATLIEVEPSRTRDIIVLALAYGILAAERRMEERAESLNVAVTAYSANMKGRLVW